MKLHPFMLVITCLSMSVIAAGQPSSFVARRDFSTTSRPYSATTADVNGDGIPDMIAAVGTSISVLLGNGDGSFQPPINSPSGGNFRDSSEALAIADFNGDGILDVAMTSTNTNSVFVMLGNGDGTFQVPTQYATDLNTNFVVVGDFNGDGIPDLAVTNQGNLFQAQSGSVSILLGNGDGTFAAAVNYPVGSGPRSVTIGDFNGDGVMDLAVSNWGYKTNNSDDNPNYVPDTTVSILFGNGDGTFGTAQNHNAGSGPRKVITGDFNHDGLVDLAVITQQSSAAGQGSLVLLFGDGNGGFSDGGTYVLSSVPEDLQSGDVNGDGINDLLAAMDSGNIAVLVGSGNGTFTPGPEVAAEGLALTLALADFNGDGLLDIEMTGNDPGVSVIFHSPDSSLFEVAAHYAAGRQISEVVTADFNHDGHPDVAVTSAVDNTVSVLMNNGEGILRPASAIAVGQEPTALVAVDVNGDGNVDLVVANTLSDNVFVLLGNGDGTFQPPISAGSVFRPTSIAVGDFNGDGIPDLAIGGNSNPGQIAILLGNGDGTYQSPIQVNTGSNRASAIAAGDFNGDGNLDLAVLTATGVNVLSGNGDGTFQPLNQISLPGGVPQQLAVGDLNHDGTLDLAVTFNSSTPLSNPNGLYVITGNGDGTFADPVAYTVGFGPSAVTIADVTGDGVPDLVVQTNSWVAVLTGNGDAGFQDPVLFGPGGHWVTAADLNGDGKIDLVVGGADFAQHGVGVLLNITP